jgi:K+-sensing histidine kinase KdpD
MLGLRGRIVLLVLIALLPMLILFVVPTRQERLWLLGEAEDRALLIARAWNQHNGEYLDEANVLLRLVNDVSPSGGACEQKLGLVTYQTQWRAEVAIIDRAGEVLCSSKSESTIAGRLDPSYLGDLFESRLLEISEFKLDENAQSVAFAGLRLPKAAAGAITIATRVVGERVTLSLGDTGPGIAAETLPRIFHSLFSTRSFGMGLGLPTARNIVEQHDGTITVESAPGQGTRVTITLPLGAYKHEDAAEGIRAVA